MIPADIGAEVSRLLRTGAAAGDLPAAAAGLSAAGTWRPATAAAGGGAGTYATSLPLAVARLADRPATPIAAWLASGLGGLPWVASARVTGGGYLTVTVTPRHLAGLAARIVAAGPAAAESNALAGRRLTAPGPQDPGAAPNWEQAWRAQRDALAGQLARAAGADVLFFPMQLDLSAASATQAGVPAVPVTGTETGGAPAAQADPGPVRAAVAYHGADAVRYALARASAPRSGPITRQLGLPLDLANPFVAVRYAHADAASTLRWAAGLWPIAGRRPGPRPAAGSATGQLLLPELALLDAMSWLPERVAAAARRRRPATVTAYLEFLASTWLDCRESCPALPFCGSGAPAAAAGPQASARLGLADAARATLSCGLGLLGIAAPERV